jgi:hypothetical protein
MANQLVEAQSKKLNQKMAELALYQSFVKSKGLDLPTAESSDRYFIYNEMSEQNRLIIFSLFSLVLDTSIKLDHTETDGDTTEVK